MKHIIAQYTGLHYDHVDACTFYLVEPQAILDQLGRIHVATALACTLEKSGMQVDLHDQGKEYLYALAWRIGPPSVMDILRIGSKPAQATHWLALDSFYQRRWIKDWRDRHINDVAEAAAYGARVIDSAISEVFRRPCVAGKGIYLQGFGTASGVTGYVFQVPVNVLAEKVLHERALVLVDRDPQFYFLGPRRGSSANPAQYLSASCWYEHSIARFLQIGQGKFPKRATYVGGSDIGFAEGRSYEVFSGTTADYYVAYDDNGKKRQVPRSGFAITN